MLCRIQRACNRCGFNFVIFFFAFQVFCQVFFSLKFCFFFYFRLFNLLADQNTLEETLVNYWDAEYPLEYASSKDCIYVVVRETLNRFVRESARTPGIFVGVFWDFLNFFFELVEGSFAQRSFESAFWMFARRQTRSLYMSQSLAFLS